MKHLILSLALLALLIAPVAIAQDEPAEEAAPAPALEGDDAIAAYTLGIQMGQQLADLGALDYDALALGVKDAVEGNDPKVTQEQMMQAMQMLQQKMMAAQQAAQAEVAAKGDKLRELSDKILEENKQKDDIHVTESGLQYKVIEEGTGASPTENDSVTVHYTGTFADGEVFDSSVERGQPATFNVGGVIPGWTEALQIMKVGAKYKLWIPGDLAYGPNGRGDIPPDAMLIFDVELIAIN